MDDWNYQKIQYQPGNGDVDHLFAVSSLSLV